MMEGERRLAALQEPCSADAAVNTSHYICISDIKEDLVSVSSSL